MAQRRTVNVTVVSSIPTRVSYLFLFRRSGKESKRIILPPLNTFTKIVSKVGNGLSYTKLPLSILLYVGYSLKLNIFFSISVPVVWRRSHGGRRCEAVRNSRG